MKALQGKPEIAGRLGKHEKSRWKGVFLKLLLMLQLCCCWHGASGEGVSRSTRKEAAVTDPYRAITRIQRDLTWGFADLEGPNPRYSKGFDEDMKVVDEAERKGVSMPALSVRGRQALEHWRKLHARQQIVDSAPWREGPTTIVMAPEIEPLSVPEGVRVLDPAALAKVRQQLGQQSIQSTSNSEWAFASKDGWVVRLSVAESGFVKDTYLGGALLSTLAFRRNPVGYPGSPAVGQADYRLFDAARVQWIVEPVHDANSAKAMWAYTTGFRDDRQVGQPDEVAVRWSLLGSQHIVMAEFDGVGLPAVVNVSAGFASIWQSLKFRSGHRHADGAGAGKTARIKLADLVTGGLPPLEASLTRIAKQRDSRLAAHLMVVIVVVLVGGSAGLFMIYTAVGSTVRDDKATANHSLNSGR